MCQIYLGYNKEIAPKDSVLEFFVCRCFYYAKEIELKKSIDHIQFVEVENANITLRGLTCFGQAEAVDQAVSVDEEEFENPTDWFLDMMYNYELRGQNNIVWDGIMWRNFINDFVQQFKEVYLFFVRNMDDYEDVKDIKTITADRFCERSLYEMKEKEMLKIVGRQFRYKK